MTERLIGIETEYAISCAAIGTIRKDLVFDLLQLAKERLAYFPDLGEGLFLGNGSKLYVDYGTHPELATPECATPWEVVRYILAGERILTRLISELQANGYYGNEISLYKCNVDYTSALTTWGCHESYLHRMNQAELCRQIIPHLVSRIIYTGAGGFNSHSPGLEFTLSPRVPHLTQVTSSHSTSDRAIFHTKDEPLAQAGYHRLHLICGESLCSETSMWLKVATTALVVAMAEAGLQIGNAVELVAPLQAMQDFASDPQGKATAELARRRRMTAIEIQRHYLGRAEAHMHDSFMPGWAEQACRKWRAILDRLESGSEGVKTTLDWAIKLALYADFARRQGIEWGLDGKGLRLDDLYKFRRVRKQLFEIDTRFGQLTGGGVFNELARSGVLDHEVPGIGDVERAMTDPPETGRARLRGQLIKRLARRRGDYQCDWHVVWDARRELSLDLTDPFVSEEKWRKPNEIEQAIVFDSYEFPDHVAW